MQLLCPSFLGVQAAQEQHQQGSEAVVFFRCDLFSRSSFVENARSLLIAARSYVTVFKTMIGESSTVRMEVIVTTFECIQEMLQRANVAVARRLKPADPAIELIWRVNLKGTIRTEGGINAKTVFGIVFRRID